MTIRISIPLLLAAPLCWTGTAQASDLLLRFPDISASQVVFVQAGDVYVAGRNGGKAERLTAHPGQELYPKFSPDGQWIAFSAEYSGTRQVYVMPSAGGAPRQLTWYTDVGPMPMRGGTDYRVLDWTPDGKHVVVRMNRLGTDERAGRPYLVPVAGGLEQPLAVPESGGGMLSPDGTAFVYTPIDRDFRSWKRYRGGRAQDVWVYRLDTNDAQRMTTFAGSDHQPVWVGDRILFASDRDGTLNLYAMPAGSAEPQDTPQQVTRFTDFDVLWPSAGANAVVFEQGGALWRLDGGAGEPVRLEIDVPGEYPEQQPVIKPVAGFIEGFDLSPNAARVVFSARGELFSVPAKDGVVRNLTLTPGVREMSVVWSPDGKHLAYLSDATGEYEIYLKPAQGEGAARRLTNGNDTWINRLTFSPDGRFLVFSDERKRLRILEVASGKIAEIDRSRMDGFESMSFSPDSRYLAYTKVSDNNLPSIWVYDIAEAKAQRLLDDTRPNFSPSFDPKGRYLYFLSNRDFQLTNSAYEFNYLYTDATRVYALSLNPDVAPIHAQDSDEALPAADTGATETKQVRIEFAQADQRVEVLKLRNGTYQGLTAMADGVLVWAPGEPGGEGGGVVKRYTLADHEAKDIIHGVGRFALSGDQKKLLVNKGAVWAIIDPSPGQDLSKSTLKTEQMELRIDPSIEWQQMFVDSWRILRDWFYDPGVHGGLERWQTIRARYEPLVAHVHSRRDLDYLLHELSGEANAGHVYVEGGDFPTLPRKAGGFLGAEFETDASGFFRISKIFPGENWAEEFRSPLTEAGVSAKVGDFLISVDGVAANTVLNPYQLFEGKAGRVVEIRLASTPAADAGSIQRVRLQDDERWLRYLDWVQTRRAMVDRLSGGRIGYFHLPNTAVEGNRELAKGMLAYAHKDALIIDDRYNGGGFIPDRMIELLARKPLNYWKRRELDPQATPLLHHDGPKAMLINGLSSSGGDALPYYFKKLNLGTVIGTRTWGGLIGISGNPGLVDGGAILAATFRFMNTEGQWAVENEGVSPDIEVIDRPDAVAAGQDPSLEKAVEVLLKELDANPPEPVVAPPAPTEFR
ncbi:MAG: PD40 domain-containing protein [Ahniella sp.]|nr:PD40 domain-containing protein [Ahniella sp.]